MTEKRTAYISIILIVVLGFAVYGNSLKGEFIWDDNILVKDNPYIRDWSNIVKVFTENIGAGTDSEFRYYRPIHIFTYMIDYSVWGLNAMGYHLTNVIFHISVALCVYWLVTVLFGDRLLSFFTGILFVIHPVHTETVASISIRGDLLSALFTLLCFIFYIKLHGQKTKIYYILVPLSCILALLSKENSLILPALLLLYHYTFKKKIDVGAFIPLLIIACAYIILRLTILGSVLMGTSWIATIFQRIPGFFVAITNYIRLLVFPFHLHAEYGQRLFGFMSPAAILGVAILFSSLIAAFRKKKTNAWISFSVGWFFIALLPVSNLYPIGFYMAEHYLYLPSIGFFLILAKGLSYLYNRRASRAVTVGCVTVLTIFYSYLAISQNEYWRDQINFFERTLKYAPDSWRICNNLGLACYNTGRKQDAIPLYEKAIEINPKNAEAYNNLANVYYDMGRREEAIALYEKALKVNPNHAKAYYNLGVVYSGLGKNRQAAAFYKKSIEINPNHAKAYYNLGNAYYAFGDKEKAIDAYKKAIEINPAYTAAHNNLSIVEGH